MALKRVVVVTDIRVCEHGHALGQCHLVFHRNRLRQVKHALIAYEALLAYSKSFEPAAIAIEKPDFVNHGVPSDASPEETQV